MPEVKRPGLVIVVVITDSQEKSNKELIKTQIRQMIGRQQQVYNWHFLVPGANQDAFAEASDMGMSAAGVSNFVAKRVLAASGVTGEMPREYAANRNSASR